ncbi:hypothetical protein EGY25_02505 [Brevundimonas intermedia]|uniref:Uncharacterized protein n=1 Tax=Brevundimonas intermedia TaxID=74315 RepID=A0A4Y9S3K7_9CAUL|nr:hypothetical protein [Brevundimonas intermedia]TFW14098.1 hypothetical protein EGY25_02505 [Brevundimonas intermedia]
MRSALAFTTLLTAASLVASGAVAQQASTNPSGLRYLSWPGKPPVAARSAQSPAPRPAVTQAEAPQPTVVAANRTIPGAIPLARLAPAPSTTTPRSNGLTPASAWMGQPAPTPVQSAPAQSTPAPYTPAPQPQPPEPVQSQPQPQAEVAPAPVPQQTAQAAPEPQPEPQPQPAEAVAVADPMAPRRDAPIYRLQRPQAGVPLDGAAVAANQQAAQMAPTGDNSARYYSVHRQAGRHPDAIQAPQQTYLDALPVEMTQTPRSNDLAQPDGPPALIRNANGSLRAVPQTEADDLP